MKEHVFLSKNQDGVVEDYWIMYFWDTTNVLTNRVYCSGNTFILTLFWRDLRDLRALLRSQALRWNVWLQTVNHIVSSRYHHKNFFERDVFILLYISLMDSMLPFGGLTGNLYIGRTPDGSRWVINISPGTLPGPASRRRRKTTGRHA